jgi:hypothetical protein
MLNPLNISLNQLFASSHKTNLFFHVHSINAITFAQQHEEDTTMSTRMVQPCQAHEFTINAMHTVMFFHQYGKAATLSDHGEDIAQAMHVMAMASSWMVHAPSSTLGEITPHVTTSSMQWWGRPKP